MNEIYSHFLRASLLSCVVARVCCLSKVSWGHFLFIWFSGRICVGLELIVFELSLMRLILQGGSLTVNKLSNIYRYVVENSPSAERRSLQPCPLERSEMMKTCRDLCTSSDSSPSHIQLLSTRHVWMQLGKFFFKALSCVLWNPRPLSLSFISHFFFETHGFLVFPFFPPFFFFFFFFWSHL